MNIILTVLICFFAAYGVFQILYAIACYMTGGNAEIRGMVHTLVPVTDKTDNIEGYIRYLALKDNSVNVILLNMTNDIEKIKIMRLLASEYDFVYIMSKDDYLEYISDEF